MWVCPICSNKEKKENVCGSCGYDNRKDFLRYQTLCVVPKEDIEEWNKLSNKSCKKIYSDGSWYEGEFKNNECHGKGIMVYTDGTRYEGEFRNGEFHGKGICCFASGDRYEGEFSNSHRHGKGIYYFADGQIQDGQWKEGEFVGEAVDENKSSSGFKVYKNSSGFRVS